MTAPPLRRLLSGAALALAMAAAGCSDRSTPPPAPAAGAKTDAPAAAAPKPASPADGKLGSVRGVVSLKGTPPTMPALKRSADPVCAHMPERDEAVKSAAGKLENAVVHVVGAPARTDAADPWVTVDQKDCAYLPRVQVGRAGQGVKVHNSDATLHNVHAYSESKTIFNVAQPAQAPAMEKTLPGGIEVLKLRCDVHPWMVGYVVFSPNGHSAVTGADGRFELKGVPPGQYNVQIWHERLGTKQVPVTVKPGETAEVAASFDSDERGS